MMSFDVIDKSHIFIFCCCDSAPLRPSTLCPDAVIFLKRKQQDELHYYFYSLLAHSFPLPQMKDVGSLACVVNYNYLGVIRVLKRIKLGRP